MKSQTFKVNRTTNFADLTAPRFSARTYRYKIVSRELHSKWKEETGSKLDYTSFRAIWRMIAEQYKESIIEETDGVLLSHGIGEVYMGYVVGGKRAINYKESKKCNQTIFFENFHSDGKRGKLIFASDRIKYKMKRNKWWSFKAHTKLKDMVALAFINHPERYKNSREKVYKHRHDNRTTNIRAEDQAEAS